MVNREEQLIAENGVLKERLYACHALGLPEVAAALAGHLDVMDVDVYEHRARLQGLVTQGQRDLQDAQVAIRERDTVIRGLSAVARKLWRDLGHDPETEPLPEVEL